MKTVGKKRMDINELAFAIANKATGVEPPKEKPAKKTVKAAAAKNPAAVELGRRGGLVGGKRRLETMTAEQRSEAARKAAQARWKKKDT